MLLQKRRFMAAIYYFYISYALILVEEIVCEQTVIKNRYTWGIRMVLQHMTNNSLCTLSLSRLKELLNMVYRKGQSWDLYSSASVFMIYLCIHHQILQNVICSRITQHFIQQEHALCQFKRRYSFVLIVFQCGATLITCSLIL